MTMPSHTRLPSRCAPLVGCLVLAAATLAAGAPPAEARRTARQYRFDGFRLGTSYGRLMQRAPYSTPCDNDPIDQRRRRFMVYGALPCRGQVFPEQTTVMIYLRMSPPGSPKYAQPIEALGWLHGAYFRKRSTFPVQPGDRLAKARRLFGKPLGQMTLRGKRGLSVTVWRFPGDVQILTEGTLVRGVVVGPMPTDPGNEQWRGLMQMLRRYTPPSGQAPATPPGLTGLCAKLWRRAVACRSTSRLAAKVVSSGDRFERKCTRKLSRPRSRGDLECMTRSRTCAAFERCGRRR